MTTRVWLRSGLLFACVVLAGCYTVLTAPLPQGGAERQLGAASGPSAQQRLTGTTKPNADQWEDYYRYPGTPSGMSLSGYGYGGYGGYGGGAYGRSDYYGASDPYYGYYGSYYGASPVYYGYDPYYRDVRGYYVPEGYQLVSARELDDLRAAKDASGTGTTAPTAAELEAAKKAKEQQEIEAWQGRLEPRVRSAPTPTPKTDTGTSSQTATGSTASPTPNSTSTGKTSTGDSSTSTEKASAQPRKTRR